MLPNDPRFGTIHIKGWHYTTLWATLFWTLCYNIHLYRARYWGVLPHVPRAFSRVSCSIELLGLGLAKLTCVLASSSNASSQVQSKALIRTSVSADFKLSTSAGMTPCDITWHRRASCPAILPSNVRELATTFGHVSCSLCTSTSGPPALNTSLVVS